MFKRPVLQSLGVALTLALAACGGTTVAPLAGDDSIEVGTITVLPERVLLSSELPGRVESTRVAEVRARVAGIVLERHFEEGSEVEAGQLLFRIDPAPFEASVLQARANLDQARASLAAEELVEKRYSLLVGKAISQHDYDQAVARRQQAQAQVAQAEAVLQRTELDLEYAMVRAPISGRIGRALVTEGALVGQGEATPLATIQTLDPVYVNITQSTNDLLQLREAMANGEILGMQGDEAPVAIQLSNGHRYEETGKLLFSDITVDPSTGQVTMRALVPNPDGVLLPGMYVRADVQQGVQEHALAVPAQAVQRDANGTASVMLVTDNGMAQRQVVEVGAMQGDRWIVEEGLAAGDTVMVDRLQRVQPGMKVAAVPWYSPGNDEMPITAMNTVSVH
ncbi:MAG: efflux RND transporter periplasmic adaptor subunit [Porticoccaceae bacterium]